MKIARPNIIRNGKRLTQTQIGKIIRKELRLSKAQYQKYYDITRNKLRNYERVTGAQKQSVLQFLYNRANYKAQARREGETYKKSFKTRYIEKFSSISSGKKGAVSMRLQKQTERYISQVFGKSKIDRNGIEKGSGLLAKNEYAKAIAEKIKDPVKRLQALTDFANKRQDLLKDRKGEIKVGDTPFRKGMGYVGYDTDEDAYNDVIEKYGGSSL